MTCIATIFVALITAVNQINASPLTSVVIWLQESQSGVRERYRFNGLTEPTAGCSRSNVSNPTRGARKKRFPSPKSPSVPPLGLAFVELGQPCYPTEPILKPEAEFGKAANILADARQNSVIKLQLLCQNCDK
jgi:hypothetical protein